MLMQQVREVMAVNRELKDESSWIWLTSEQTGFPLRSEFAKENHGEARSLKQCNDQRTDQTAFPWRLSSHISFRTREWSKDDDTKTQCNQLNTSPLHGGNASNKNGPARVKQRMQWETPSKPLAVDDSLLLRE